MDAFANSWIDCMRKKGTGENTPRKFLLTGCVTHLTAYHGAEPKLFNQLVQLHRNKPARRDEQNSPTDTWTVDADACRTRR